MKHHLLIFWMLGGFLVQSYPITGIPCNIDSLSNRISCLSSTPNLTINSYQFGSVSIITSSSYTTVYNNYSDCIVNGCHNYNVRCDCTSVIGSNACTLGQFYSLRRGVGSNGTCLFGAFSPLRECADTNWVPSITSPAPLCPNFRLVISPTVNVSGNYTGLTYAYTSLISATANLSGLYKMGTSLYSIPNSTNLTTWSIGSLFTSNVQYRWASNCSGNPTSHSDPRLGTFQRQYCQNPTLIASNPSVSSVYEHYFILRSDRWFIFKAVFPTGNITVRYCQQVCERFNILTSSYDLLPSGTYLYDTEPDNFQCETQACINKDCCDPSYIHGPDPCLGSVNGVCTSNITYFDTSTNTFVGQVTDFGFYCSSTTGECFKLPHTSDWSLNTLGLLLIGLLSAIALVIAISLIVKFSSFSSVRSM